MADVFGFTNLPLSGTSEVVLYTCPIVSDSVDQGTAEDVTQYAQIAITQSQITSIIACAHTTGADLSLYLTPDTTAPASQTGFGGTDSLNWILLDAASLSDGATTTYNFGLVLRPGQTIWAKASAADKITMFVNHIEISR